VFGLDMFVLQAAVSSLTFVSFIQC